MQAEEDSMGEKVAAHDFSREDRQKYREKLHSCLDVFGRMLSEAKFDFEQPLTGMEIEFNLVDDEHDPAMRNDEVLKAIENHVFQAEVGQFNIELNARPGTIAGHAVENLERDLRASLNKADERARSVGAHIVMIGVLPTLMPEHLTEASTSADPRYNLLH